MDVKFQFSLFPWQYLGREMLILKRVLLGDETALASLFIMCE